MRSWDHDLGADQPHLLDAADGRDLTSQPGGGLRGAGVDLSDDGRFLVTSWQNPSAGAALRDTLVRIEVDTGERITVADDPGGDLGNPAVSPDGSAVAFTRETISTPLQPPRTTLCCVRFGETVREVTAHWDRWPTSVTWSRDGKTLIVTADDNGRGPIFLVDPDTEDYLNALADVARLWPACIQARTYGGSVGSACLSFKFSAGKPVVENHDPRWCDVEFTDRESGTVKKLTKLYMNSRDEPGPQGWQTHWYWYRREITETQDILFKPVRVDEGGKAPTFTPDRVINHNFGFCPVVWIQNEPDQHALDGVSDIACVLELIEGLDQLTSQAHRGILANCDPTLVLTTDMEFSSLRKGSDNAIKLPPGSGAQYLEISGSGPERALTMAAQLRRYALEVAQCVLDNAGEVAQTATEIQRSYASMLARADILREQYGQRGVLPLLEMMLKAARMIEQGDVLSPDGQQMELDLPPRMVDGEDGPQLQPRQLGPVELSARVDLQWGPYFERTVDEALKATQTAAAAKASGLVDAEHATKYVARYFDVQDPEAMLRSMVEAAAEQQREMDEQMMMASAVQGGEDVFAAYAAAEAAEEAAEEGDEA